MRKILSILLALLIVSALPSCDKIKKLWNEDTEQFQEPKPENDDNKEASDTDKKTETTNTAIADSTKKSVADSTANKAAKDAEAAKDSVEKLGKEISNQTASLDTISTELSTLKSNLDDKIDKSSARTFMTVGLLLLTALFGFLTAKLFKKTSRLKERIRELEYKVRMSSGQSTSSGVGSADLRKLSTSVKDLNTKVSNLEAKVIRMNATSKPAEPSVKPKSPTSSTPPQNTSVFYMPRTSEERKFDNSRKRYAPDDTTFFKFTLVGNNPTKATFEFSCAHQNIIRSYDDRDNSMATVCDITISSMNPSSCKTLEKGTAELRGNIWHVIDKVKIEYV